MLREGDVALPCQSKTGGKGGCVFIPSPKHTGVPSRVLARGWNTIITASLLYALYKLEWDCALNRQASQHHTKRIIA